MDYFLPNYVVIQEDDRYALAKQPDKVDKISAPVLQRRQLKCAEVLCLSHAAGKWQDLIQAQATAARNLKGYKGASQVYVYQTRVLQSN